MRVRLLTIAAIGGLVVPVLATSAVAGGFGCRERGECYARVPAPDAYETVARPYVIRPAHAEVVHSPAVIGSRQQWLETRPGHINAEHLPAQVGKVTKSVMVRPGHVAYERVPAQYSRVMATEIVTPASWRWEMKADRHGRVVKCRVHVPAVTRTVEKTVMVSPAHTVAHTRAPVYRTVTQSLLLAPARTRHTYTHGAGQWVDHPMTLKAATSRVEHHPAVIGVRHETVRVKRGGHHWQRVGAWH